MPARKRDPKDVRLEQESGSQRQIAFVSGLFQGDVTIRTLLESLAEGIVIIDKSSTILLVNGQTENIFGYPEQELVGQPLAVLVPERFRKLHEKQVAQFFENPRIRRIGQLSDLIGLRRDGSEFPVEIGLSFLDTVNGRLGLAFIIDVSERKRAEKGFMGVLESAPDAMLIVNGRGEIRIVNSETEKLFGYERGELYGQAVEMLMPERFRDRHRSHRAEYFLNPHVRRLGTVTELYGLHKDGHEFPVDISLSPLSTDEGVLVIAAVRDIGERKLAEESLRFSEARYRALFRDNPVMIVTLDADWTMLSVNPTCADQLGYMIEELEGQSVLKLFHEDDRSAVAEQLRLCMQHPDQVYRWQFRKRRKDGEVIWVEEVAHAVDGPSGSLNLLVVCDDITERRRMADELKEAGRQNELILASAGEGILGLDMEGKHTFVNASAAAMLGYDAEELVGRHSHSTWHFAKPDGSVYPDKECPVYAAYKDGVIHSGEEVFWRKDGTGFPVEFTSRPMFADGNTVGAVLTFKDITERKRVEREIEGLNATLAARAAELEAANRDLEAFTYSVSHDLLNSLLAIGSHAQMLQEQFCSKQDDQCRSYTKRIYEKTKHLGELIGVMHDFFRPASIELHREMIDLSAIAAKVAEKLRMTKPERRVTFGIAKGVTVNGDANLLRVVLENLIDNAWKHTGRRGAAIIEFGMTEVEGRPAYFVRDNGTGFDMAHADRLFMPFQRLPGTDEFAGQGIGLATVERIVRRHGGRVWAEGEPDKGATFYFTLGSD